MSFDWIDFLLLAEGLYNNPQSLGPEEASWRSSASRAYYAVFRMVRDFAETETGYEVKGFGTDHTSVPLHLQASDHKPHVDIGIKLDRLRLNRRWADYDDNLKQGPRKLAEVSVLTARRILELMNNQPEAQQ